MSILREDRLTVREAAALVGVSENTLLSWINRGLDGTRLRSIRIGRRHEIAERDLEAFVLREHRPDDDQSFDPDEADAANALLERLGA